MKRLLIGIVALLVGVAGNGCGSESTTSEEEVGMDSVEVAVPSEPMAIELTAPELLGKWQLVNQRVGELFISPAEIDNPVREFTADGQMILTTNASDPHTVSYTYLDGVISTLQEGDQLVSFLSADSLVLTETVDGVEAEYVYRKVPE